MKIRPLIVTDTERALIRGMIAHAERNVISIERFQRMIIGEEKPVGDDPDFVCVIPLGYRCVFTLDEQPCGLCRHLSVSVLGQGAAPNPAAVEMLAAEFGFRGGVKDMFAVWTEPVPPKKVAVNFLQLRDAS
jgi:hypothetical protein